jgi:MFS transporter, MHS family, proline/betaine transporter
MSKSGSTRVLGAASIGNFGEIYDFAVFGFSVPILSTHFFPRGNPAAAILSTFAVYAVAFFARPLGGLMFGLMADRVGRVKVMAATVWLMALGTALVGVLPTYAEIGIGAPLLLVACRIAQGLALGGETTGSTSFVLESAPDDRRARWVGFIFVFAHLPNTLVALMLLGIQMWAGSTAYEDWVWRIPFLAGGLIGIVGFWLRRSLDEPEEFKQAARKTRGRNPLLSATGPGINGMLYVAMIQPIQTVSSYLLLGFLYTFLVREAKLDSTSALLSNGIAVAVLAVCIPVGGMLSDRFGRKRILSLGAIWLALAAYPAVQLASTGTLAGALIGQILLAIGIGIYDGPCFTAAPEFFPTAFRATGHAISYQLAVAIFGGTTPLVSAWLVSRFETPLAPAYYVTFVAVACLFAIQFVPETKGVSLRTSVGPASSGPEGAAVRDLR